MEQQPTLFTVTYPDAQGRSLAARRAVVHTERGGFERRPSFAKAICTGRPRPRSSRQGADGRAVVMTARSGHFAAAEEETSFATAPKDAGSWMAISDRIFRSRATPAFLSPLTRRE